MNRNNEQKNTYVKKQITLALLELLKEKPLVDISISELTQKAQIGRVSFYRNYQTKEDILREESDRLLKEWGKLYEENPASSPGTLFPSLFDFYREHKEFYTILYQAGMTSIEIPCCSMFSSSSLVTMTSRLMAVSALARRMRLLISRSRASPAIE